MIMMLMPKDDPSPYSSSLEARTNRKLKIKQAIVHGRKKNILPLKSVLFTKMREIGSSCPLGILLCFHICNQVNNSGAVSDLLLSCIL